MELWKIVNNGPYAIPKITNDKGEEVNKPNDHCTSSDQDKLTKKSKVEHLFSFGGLYAKEYNLIYVCEIAKQVWNKLIVTYEGTSQVRE